MAEKLWYLAYGSNMSRSKFTGGRGIVPLESARVRVPGWELIMEIPGMPYSEPSFSSIVQRRSCHVEHSYPPQVVGVAYLITQDQYRSVIASEGGGTAYHDITLSAEPVEGADRDKTGPCLQVRTLSSAMTRHPPPAPSRRYMDLVIKGAREARLPPKYQQYLADAPTFEPPTSPRARLGARLFLSLCGPVMQGLEQITKGSIGTDGNAHWAVIMLVRLTMLVIWALHDFVFAPLFGPGDGVTAKPRDVPTEKVDISLV